MWSDIGPRYVSGLADRGRITLRRNDDTVRVGLNSTVRRNNSSKSGNDAGPLMNLPITALAASSRDGSTSTSRIRRARSGATLLSASVVNPPSDMPTTATAFGAAPTGDSAKAEATPELAGLFA